MLLFRNELPFFVKTQSKSIRPAAMIMICKYHTTTKCPIYCALLASQWRAKTLLYLSIGWKTWSTKSSITPRGDSQSRKFVPICKLTGFVNQIFVDFFKMTLIPTPVESQKNVTGITLSLPTQKEAVKNLIWDSKPIDGKWTTHVWLIIPGNLNCWLKSLSVSRFCG